MARRVAAIQDKSGGFRVVVSDGCLYCHLGCNERIFITPYEVDAPLPAAAIVETATNYAKAELIEGNLCGGCNFCCRAPAIDVIDKPAGAMCRHQRGGCQIQKDKPLECRLFECLWLQSQKTMPMSPRLRPDRCGVMFVQKPGRLEVHAENDPRRLQNEVVKAFLKGKTTYFVTHYESKLPPVNPPSKNLVGIVYYADDPEKKIFRWVYPHSDDSELDGPAIHPDGQIACDENGEPYSWLTLPPMEDRKAVMEKVQRDDPRAKVTPWR